MFIFSSLVKLGKKVVDFIWRCVCRAFKKIASWIDSVTSSPAARQIIDGMLCFIDDFVCLSQRAVKAAYNWFKTKFIKSETKYNAKNFSEITTTTRTYLRRPDGKIVERTEKGVVGTCDVSTDVIEALFANRDGAVEVDDRKVLLTRFKKKAREEYGDAVLL